VRSDLSINFAKLAAYFTNSPTLAMDEEVIAFKDEAFDIIISNLSLHWVNDLPGTLSQLRRVLKPDGVFLATLLGEETLTELRQSFVDAEIEIENGLSPRFSPFIEIKSAGNLLVRAGFSLPVADIEKVTISYPNALTLMNDLRGMGESNAHTLRKRTFSRRSTLIRAADIYRKKFGNADGRINATFDIICITGWAPHENQQKPLRPGSGTINFETALNSKQT
jgi:SAM-dependent methyltransferase